MTAINPGTAPGNPRLWELLPAFLTDDDVDAGGVLRALLNLISADVDAVERGVWDLYDDLFIETCAEWAVPYLGALVANDLLYDASRHDDARTATALFGDLSPNDLRAPVAARARADVAQTIAYRRRKGTPAMLEELARNVTGWPVRLVECFQLLDWPQHLDHLRPQAALIDVRSPERCERAAGAFSDAVRTVDVRLPRLGTTSGSVIAAGAPGVSDAADDKARVESVAIDPVEPPYHPRTAAFFAWRLQAAPLVWVTPKGSPTCAFGWTFSPLGNPAPLFSRWVRDGDEFGRATELQIPQPIRRALFAQDLSDYAALPPVRPPFSAFYGQFADPAGTATELAPHASVAVIRNGAFLGVTADPTAPVALYQPQVICMRLDPWPAAQPPGLIVGIDVAAGRFVLGAGFTSAADPVTSLAVDYLPGQAAGHGGGGYDRSSWLIPTATAVAGFETQPKRLTVGTRPQPAATPPPDFATIGAAVTAWQALVPAVPAIIEITDSASYDLPPTLLLANNSWLVIEAGNGERPHLRTPAAGWPVDVTIPAGDRDRGASLTLSGLLIEGSIELVGELRQFRLWHTTVVPGRSLGADGAPATTRPSIVVDPAGGQELLQIEVAFSILGPLRVPNRAAGVWLLDSILDGLDALADGTPAPGGGAALTGPGGALTDPGPPNPAVPGPPLHLERSTVLGAIQVASLDASEGIFTGHVQVQRTQEGCVRFSYVTVDSVTPRRYRCQPDLTAQAAAAAEVAAAFDANPALTAAQAAAIAAAARAQVAAALVPTFTSPRYGHPAYGQLHRSTPVEITRGGADGSEMGALAHVKQSQRQDNLRLRLAEYLPFGLDPALVYVT
jgi:hypothetical protein